MAIRVIVAVWMVVYQHSQYMFYNSNVLEYSR